MRNSPHCASQSEFVFKRNAHLMLYIFGRQLKLMCAWHVDSVCCYSLVSDVYFVLKVSVLRYYLS